MMIPKEDFTDVTLVIDDGGDNGGGYGGGRVRGYGQSDGHEGGDGGRF